MCGILLKYTRYGKLVRWINILLFPCWVVSSIFLMSTVHLFKGEHSPALAVVVKNTKPTDAIYYPEEYDLLDYHNSTNPYPFKYLINNETKCAGVKTINYLIYVLSAPHHFKYRRVLRKTWAKENLFRDWESRLVFLVAYTHSTKDQEHLYHESKLYGDIIQEDYVDSYSNLTYKGMQALKWVHKYCNNAEIVIKTDEDIYVNIFAMRKVWEKRLVNKTNWFLCKVNVNKVILRDGDCGKWCVAQEDIPRMKIYPSFCDGPMYMWDGRMATNLLNASLNTPFFWLEDVYLTGFAANKIPGRRLVDIGYMYRVWDRYFKKQFYSDNPRKYIVGLLPTVEEKLEVWKKNLLSLSPEEIALIGEENYHNLMAETWDTV